MITATSPVCADRLPSPDSLIWLRGEDNYTWLYHRNARPQISAYTQKRYASCLAGFIRIRHDGLVNPAYIVRCESTPGGLTLHLTDGTRTPVARRRVRAVRKLLAGEGTDVWRKDYFSA